MLNPQSLEQMFETACAVSARELGSGRPMTYVMPTVDVRLVRLPPRMTASNSPSNLKTLFWSQLHTWKVLRQYLKSVLVPPPRTRRDYAQRDSNSENTSSRRWRGWKCKTIRHDSVWKVRSRITGRLHCTASAFKGRDFSELKWKSWQLQMHFTPK